MTNTVRTHLAATAVFIGFFFAGPALAQSKIQCEVTESGAVVAPLVWQNTLGVERANSICQQTVASQPRSVARSVENPSKEQVVAPVTAITKPHQTMHERDVVTHGKEVAQTAASLVPELSKRVEIPSSHVPDGYRPIASTNPIPPGKGSQSYSRIW